MRIARLDQAGIPYHIVGTSALTHFFGVPSGTVTTIETTADLVDLARLFENVSFPGLPGWDLLAADDPREAEPPDDHPRERSLLVRSVDSLASAGAPGGRHPLMAFAWNPGRRSFADPHDLYPILSEARGRLGARRERRHPDQFGIEPVPVEGLSAVEAALIASRVPLAPPAGTALQWEPDPGLPVEFHRLLLTRVLDGTWAWRGLEILAQSGYIADILPELALMDHTEHSKEGHPEGNVWRHTVETFRYRKDTDLAIALALLLHDSGKPSSEGDGLRRFDGHADDGARLATRILRRFGFDDALIAEVGWLVRYHMIPGALERLPPHRRDPLMRSTFFPKLLEVYRCDLSSTYRGPENYYRACTVYRRFLKRGDSERVRLPAATGRSLE